MGKIAVIAKLSAKPGRRQELLKALEQVFPVVESTRTTEVYAMHADRKDQDTIWFYEIFSDQAALEKHAGSEALRAVTKATADLVVGPPQVTLLSPVKAKGLDL